MDIRNRITQIQDEIDRSQKKLQDLQQQEQQIVRDILAKQGAVEELQKIASENTPHKK